MPVSGVHGRPLSSSRLRDRQLPVIPGDVCCRPFLALPSLSLIFSALLSKGSGLSRLFWECAPFLSEKSSGFYFMLSAEWWGCQTPSEEREDQLFWLQSHITGMFICWTVEIADDQIIFLEDLEDERHTEEIVDRPGRIICDRKAERCSLMPGIQLGKWGKLSWKGMVFWKKRWLYSDKQV